MIDEKQCDIVWHVDDNKNSDKVIDEVIAKIGSKFGKMSKIRGDDHDFLGIKIKHKKGKVHIGMKNQAIKSFIEDITRNAATPATSYL